MTSTTLIPESSPSVAARRIADAWAGASWPGLRRLTVEVNDDVIEIQGDVSSTFEREQALRWSRRLAGATPVISRIRVVSRRSKEQAVHGAGTEKAVSANDQALPGCVHLLDSNEFGSGWLAFCDSKTRPVRGFSARNPSHPMRRELPLAATHALLSMIVLAVIALVLSGCGSSSQMELVPVEGQLTFNGQPLANAQVVFHPETASQAQVIPARANTDANGRFTLTTFKANDGAAAGRYAVTVQYYPVLQSGGDYLPGRNVLPPKYAAPAQTDLKVEVSKTASNVGVLQLKR